METTAIERFPKGKIKSNVKQQNIDSTRYKLHAIKRRKNMPQGRGHIQYKDSKRRTLRDVSHMQCKNSKKRFSKARITYSAGHMYGNGHKKNDAIDSFTVAVGK